MTWGAKKNVTHALRLAQVRRLKLHAGQTGHSLSRIMRDAIDLYFESQGEMSSVESVMGSLSLALSKLEEVARSERR